MSTNSKVVSVRLPASLHRKLTEAAADDNRSLNYQIIARLEASFDREANKQAKWLDEDEQVLKEVKHTVMHDLGNQFEARIAEMDAKFRNALDGSEQTFRELREMMVARFAELEAKVGKDEGGSK